MSSRKDTNWEEHLLEDEIVVKEGKKIVKLVGLQRLAEQAGLIRSSCTLQHIPGKNLGIVQCIYTTEFEDGFVSVGTGDCNELNTDQEFVCYPTAIAESRAESRSLKKALGIRLLTAEEIGFQNVDSMETSPNKPIAENVVKAIQVLCEEKNIEQVAVVESVVKDKERAIAIYELSQLTNEEGQRALEFLNGKKSAGSKKTTSRSERKQELLDKKKGT
jgi:hypothetical protein